VTVTVEISQCVLPATLLPAAGTNVTLHDTVAVAETR
jgi:hypothetical protein